MSRLELRYERRVSAIVAALIAVVWLIIIAINEPPEFNEQYLQFAVAWLLFATPWAIAARLLWRDWWSRHGESVLQMDPPQRLLAAAVAALPENRRDWGAAMAAELEHVPGRSARWRFAAGCAWTAMFPPQSGRVNVLLTTMLVIAFVFAIERVVHSALPAMRVFALTFTALVGAMFALAAARSRQRAEWVEHPFLKIAGIVCVGACIAVTASFVQQNPDAAEYLSWGSAVILATVLAGTLWLSLSTPQALMKDRQGLSFGVVGALLFALGFFATSRLTINTHGGPIIWVLLAPWFLYFATSAAAAVVGQSFRTGVHSAIWAAVTGTLLVFAIAIPESMHRYAIDGRMLADGESGYPIGANLPGIIWTLIVIPLLGLPFGVIGAASGRSWRAVRAESLSR